MTFRMCACFRLTQLRGADQLARMEFRDIIVTVRHALKARTVSLIAAPPCTASAWIPTQPIQATSACRIVGHKSLYLRVPLESCYLS